MKLSEEMERTGCAGWIVRGAERLESDSQLLDDLLEEINSTSIKHQLTLEPILNRETLAAAIKEGKK